MMVSSSHLVNNTTDYDEATLSLQCSWPLESQPSAGFNVRSSSCSLSPFASQPNSILSYLLLHLRFDLTQSFSHSKRISLKLPTNTINFHIWLRFLRILNFFYFNTNSCGINQIKESNFLAISAFEW